MAKGLTNAAVPMGAVARAATRIYDAIVNGVAGRDRAVPRLYLFRPSAGRGRRHRDAGTAPRRGPARPRPRHRALLAGCGAQPERRAERHRHPRHRPDRRDRAGAARRQARPPAPWTVFRRCFDAGVLVRVTGDIVALSPPLIIEKPHVDRHLRHAGRRDPRRAGLIGDRRRPACCAGPRPARRSETEKAVACSSDSCTPRSHRHRPHRAG